MGLLDKIFGSKNQKVLKKVQPLVVAINSLEAEYSDLSDEELKSEIEEQLGEEHLTEVLNTMEAN